VAKEIVIVGLGPGDPKMLTRDAWEEINSTDELFVRTGDHPALVGLPPQLRIHTFDALYEEAQDFSAVYSGITRQLLDHLANREKLVYAVPGDPCVGEATVFALRQEAKTKDIRLRLISGVSFIEPCLAIMGIDALDGMCVVDALELAAGYHPPCPPDSGILVAQLYSKMVASDVKLTLMNQYPDDHPVMLIHAAGTSRAEKESCLLFEIDRSEKIALMTALYVPPFEEASAFESFQDTIAHLRSPQGCAWDREQTHESLRMHLLEECYEALYAIDIGDRQSLQEELGDLLLQIVLQTQIATEAGDFSMADVIRGINKKIIRRHPHVFGELEIREVDDILHNWEALKAAEREEEGSRTGILNGVPRGLPALAQAHELQIRVARVGFDWPEVDGVLAKIDEELNEVIEAPDDVSKAAEMGDLLFTVVNYARWLKIDPETALREANRRFRSRFSDLEERAAAEGRKLEEMTLEEMDSLWEAVKGDAH
jgi:tetrapyrrole methylase family protein/MazG family protein